MARNNFVSSLFAQLKETCIAYGVLARNPRRFVTAIYDVAKNTFYDLPKDLLFPEESNLEKLLGDSKGRRVLIEKRNSQALAFSEFVGYFGSYTGAMLASNLGMNDFFAANIGGDVGNYITAAPAFFLTYAVLTRKAHSIENKNSLIEGLKKTRNCLPAAIASYVSAVPLISGFELAGMNAENSVLASMILTTVLFTITAKRVMDKK